MRSMILAAACVAMMGGGAALAQTESYPATPPSYAPAPPQGMAPPDESTPPRTERRQRRQRTPAQQARRQERQVCTQQARAQGITDRTERRSFVRGCMRANRHGTQPGAMPAPNPT